MTNLILLDCTLRDGGYYNSWDFDKNFIEKYLRAMKAISVDYVELGLRSLNNSGFKGPCAYTTDDFINTLEIPEEIELGVMVNASELLNHESIELALEKLFVSSSKSPISLVRIACHVHEFKEALPASIWLKEQGYIVGFNLMQIAEKSFEVIKELSEEATNYPLDVLYFADSMGSLDPKSTSEIIKVIRDTWDGQIGIHTHDNMGNALANSLCAIEEGVKWIDGTVTGMGRGPGNAKTENLIIELEKYRKNRYNIIPLLNLISNDFSRMQFEYGWGTNTYYYLAGKYSIHPTYIQEMLSDNRYNEEDILAVIDYLKNEGGSKFNNNTLETARMFYSKKPKGTWYPKEILADKEVVILGAGPGITKHKEAIEAYIHKNKPYVIALNTQSIIKEELINLRAACHPIRLLTDSVSHKKLSQPLIIPKSMLPENIINEYLGKEILDYGIVTKEGVFEFNENFCVVPNSLVLGYVLAIATSGKASKILLAGFDGYGVDDPRNEEVNDLLINFIINTDSPELIAITPTQYKINTKSIYAL